MTTKRITVELTETEAHALWRLADCAANTWDDALQVLVQPAKVSAGMRAIAKLQKALFS